jgi:hypothetical protein
MWVSGISSQVADSYGRATYKHSNRRQQMGTITRRVARAAALAGGLFLGVAAIAYATGSATSGTITACQKTKHGQLRVVTTAAECNASESAISWNAQGATGSQGPSGERGPKGDKGDPGERGPAGADATLTLASLSGSPCVTHSGQPGTIAIQTTSADDVVLHCAASASSGGSGSPGETTTHLVGLSFARVDNTHYSITITLSQAVSQQTAVQLTSSDPASVVVPATITVLVGNSTAYSTDITILGTTGAVITATLGAESIHATLTPS